MTEKIVYSVKKYFIIKAKPLTTIELKSEILLVALY